MVGVVLLTAIGISADSRRTGQWHGSGTRIVAVLLPPFGLLVHLLQTRRWTRALLLWTEFLLGAIAAIMLGGALGAPLLRLFA